jgi:hypothetical protein
MGDVRIYFRGGKIRARYGLSGLVLFFVQGSFFEKNTVLNKLNRTSICALMVFKISCCHVVNENTNFLLDSRILLDNSKNPFRISLQRPYRGDINAEHAYLKMNMTLEILSKPPMKY